MNILRYEFFGFGLALTATVWLPLAIGCGQPSSASSTKLPIVAAAEESQAAAPAETEGSAPSATADVPASDHNAVASAPQLPAGDKAKPKPPRADRTPRKPGEAERITFDDLNLRMDADMVFRDYLISSDHRVRELEGKKVSIVGYMHPPESQRGIKQFILLKNTQCKFGPGGQADHLADVSLREGQTTQFTPSDLKIEGTLRIQPFQGPDGNTWSIYRLEDAQIR